MRVLGGVLVCVNINFFVLTIRTHGYVNIFTFFTFITLSWVSWIDFRPYFVFVRGVIRSVFLTQMHLPVALKVAFMTGGVITDGAHEVLLSIMYRQVALQ
jgi:hypothetical protein